MATVLEQIKAQIAAAKPDLVTINPTAIDWLSRCDRTAEEIVPWLEGATASLIEYVEGVLNAPKKIRKMWSEIRGHVDLPETQLKAFDALLGLDEVLGKSLNGQVISSILTKRLTDTAPTRLKLTMNVGNDFPDLGS